MVTPVFPWPEFLVAASYTKFRDGELHEDLGRERLTKYMEHYARWVRTQA